MTAETVGRGTRTVLDLNVIISGIIGLAAGRASPPARCLALALERTFVLVTSPDLLEELYEVLQRPKIGLSAGLAVRWTELVETVSVIVPLPGHLDVLERDPDDNRVLECALVGGASWLVTGNLRDFEELRAAGGETITYRGIRIVPPVRFLTTFDL